MDTGQAAHDHALGQKVWEYFRDHPEDNEAFNRGLAEIRTDEQAAIAAVYDWAGVKSVVDVGAGAGALLASIVAGNPGVRGILFDRPDVLPDAERLLKTRGVRERCELVGGSFFEPIEVKGDVWILSQVLHDWPDAECRTILKRCRERMSSGDRLLVVEMVPEPGRPDAGIALLDIAMMMFGGEAGNEPRRSTTSYFLRPDSVRRVSSGQEPPSAFWKRNRVSRMSALNGFAVRYTAAWCSQNAASVAAHFAERGSLTINGGEPAIGRAAIAAAAQEFMTAFPDMVVKMDRLEVDGSHIEYHWTLTGTKYRARRNRSPGPDRRS